jgi:drug/metabolite transporter (DMT)-like permease
MAPLPATAASSGRATAWGALTLTAVLWASSAVTARGLLDTFTPAGLAAVRWVVVLLLLAPWGWRDRHAIAKAWRTDRRAILLLAIVGFAPQTWLVYLGLQGTTAINLGLLNSAIPVLIVVFAALMHGRRPSRLEIAGLAVSLTGVAVIVARGDLTAFARLALNGYDLVLLLGMVVWAYYTVRLATRTASLAFPSFMFLAGAIGLAMIVPGAIVEAIVGSPGTPTALDWIGVIYLGAMPTLIAMLLYAWGLKRIGPVHAGLFTHLVPVFSAVLATIFLGERLHGFHAVGFALVAGGAIAALLRPSDATGGVTRPAS